ncbi:hypothetical protein HMPREF1154_1375 [Capnocytophaga sp. CM59]|nr:hypothetical protein HMPREF1154_1375 [Capnocytophaga sp. CM59]
MHFLENANIVFFSLIYKEYKEKVSTKSKPLHVKGRGLFLAF